MVNCKKDIKLERKTFKKKIVSHACSDQGLIEQEKILKNILKK